MFKGCKNDNFAVDFFFTFFHIFTQNINCGNTLEPPHAGGSNGYPQYIYKWGVRGVNYTDQLSGG